MSVFVCISLCVYTPVCVRVFMCVCDCVCVRLYYKLLVHTFHFSIEYCLEFSPRLLLSLHLIVSSPIRLLIIQWSSTFQMNIHLKFSLFLWSFVVGTAGGRGGQGVRVSNNLYYNIEGDIVYPAAALGVKLQPSRSSTHTQMKSNDSSSTSTPTQTYFKGHNDDIMCLAISNCRLFVATGQTASKSSKVPFTEFTLN